MQREIGVYPIVFEVDDDLLIDEVKKRPELHHTTSSTLYVYGKTLKLDSWNDVALSIYGPRQWNTWSKDEQERALSAVRSRWHTLRETFSKVQNTDKKSKKFRKLCTVYCYSKDLHGKLNFLADKDNTLEVERRRLEEIERELDNSVKRVETDTTSTCSQLSTNPVFQMQREIGVYPIVFEVDDDLLIDEVKKRPELHHTTSFTLNVYGKMLKLDSWNDVALSIYGPRQWNTWSKDEQERALSAVRSRWHTLRETFHKVQNTDINSNKIRKLCNVICYSKDLHGKLNFLADKDNTLEVERRRLEEIERELDNSVKRVETDTTSTCSDNSTEWTEVQALKKLRTRLEKRAPPKLDSDVGFALSLVPKLKRLTKSRKLEVQIQILELLEKVSE